MERMNAEIFLDEAWSQFDIEIEDEYLIVTQINKKNASESAFFSYILVKLLNALFFFI